MIRGGPPLFINGGFESGDFSNWGCGGEIIPRVVSNIVHSGLHSALLGNPEAAPCEAPTGQTWLEREFIVPQASTGILSLWFRMFTYDINRTLADGIDHLDVLLNGRSVYRFANRTLPQRCDGLPHDLEWQRVLVDLIPFQGQTVRLMVKIANTDQYYNSWAYIDDIRVTSP